MGIRGFGGQLYRDLIRFGINMHIHEVFWSVQGEGSRSGYPSIFVRTTGCTLQCPYCDTRDAWESGTRMEIEQIVTEIEKYRKTFPRSQVVITGGEPLEQDLSGMIKLLKQKKNFLCIETNGIYFQPLEIDWWTVSPKDVADFYIAAELKEKINEVKLVVNENLNYKIVKNIRAIGEDFPIFLQPDYYDRNRFQNTFSLFSECQKKGIDKLRLGLQLHRVLGVK
jgi:organic radical activating enzyme